MHITKVVACGAFVVGRNVIIIGGSYAIIFLAGASTVAVGVGGDAGGVARSGLRWTGRAVCGSCHLR